MTAIVFPQRVAVDTSGIRSGRPVRGSVEASIASLHDWTLGRGAQLVPAHTVNATLTAGTAFIFRWYVKPRFQALERRWSVALRTNTSAGSDVDVKVPSTGTAQRVRVRPDEAAHVFSFTETLSAQSATAGQIDMEITPQDADVDVHSISCTEIPRVDLSVSNADNGIDLARYRAGAPIMLRNGFTDAYNDTLTDDSLIGRRVSLLQWAVPTLEGGSVPSPAGRYATSVTSTSYVDLFTIGIPGLARKDLVADLTGAIAGRFHAWVTTGTGDITLNATSGGSNGATITATTPTWSDQVSINIDCEDIDSADGRQTAASPAWDLLTVQARKNTSGTLYISSASVWED